MVLTKYYILLLILHLSFLGALDASEALPKRNVCFIINPISGTGKQKGLEKIIKSRLDPTLFNYEIFYTTGPKHATALSKQAAQSHFDIVVAVGGDGSVHEVAKELIGTPIPLAIIPTGSGNGLARHFNIPTDPKKALEIINKLNTIWIDTVKINEESCFGVAGVGFDADVSLAFSHFGRRGLASYIWLALNTLTHYKPQEYELIIDGQTFKKKAFLICFANSSQYGNNIHIAPHAKIDDGYLDILILKEFPAHAAPKLMHELLQKKIDHSEYTETFRCKEVILKPSPYPIHIDGEPTRFQDPIQMRVLPSSLKILVPKDPCS